MSCTRLYCGKDIRSLIVILILIVPYDIWSPSIKGIASAISEKDSSSQELSNQSPPLSTETPKAALEEKSDQRSIPMPNLLSKYLLTKTFVSRLIVSQRVRSEIL